MQPSPRSFSRVNPRPGYKCQHEMRSLSKSPIPSTLVPYFFGREGNEAQRQIFPCSPVEKNKTHSRENDKHIISAAKYKIKQATIGNHPTRSLAPRFNNLLNLPRAFDCVFTMGTRHLIIIFHNGKYKLAQYGQWDGKFQSLGAADRFPSFTASMPTVV